MQRETSINRLDDEEMKAITPDSPPQPPKQVVSEESIEDEEIKEMEEIQTPDVQYSNEDIILFCLLLIVLHPGINSQINSYMKLGGATFVAKALLVVAVYILFKRFM